MVVFCNLLGKEGDLGGVMASCGELDKSPAMEQESTLRFHPRVYLMTIKRRGMLLYMYMQHSHLFCCIVQMHLKCHIYH